MNPNQEVENLLKERKRGVKPSVYTSRLVDLIYQGADVNKPFATLQSVKTVVGRPELLGTLIKHGANVASPFNNHKDNILMVAIEERNVRAVEEILLHARIHVNARNAEKQTASMLAAASGQPHILELLVKAGADLFKTDDEGYNTLHYAAMSNAPELIPYLVRQHQMNPNKKTQTGYTPLMIAVEKYMDTHNSYHLKTVKELAKLSDLHLKNREGKNIFEIIDQDWEDWEEEAQDLKNDIRNALKSELDSRLKTIYHVVKGINKQVDPQDQIELPDDIVSKIAILNLDHVQASDYMKHKFARRDLLQKAQK